MQGDQIMHRWQGFMLRSNLTERNKVFDNNQGMCLFLAWKNSTWMAKFLNHARATFAIFQNLPSRCIFYRKTTQFDRLYFSQNILYIIREKLLKVLKVDDEWFSIWNKKCDRPLQTEVHGLEVSPLLRILLYNLFFSLQSISQVKHLRGNNCAF